MHQMTVKRDSMGVERFMPIITVKIANRIILRLTIFDKNSLDNGRVGHIHSAWPRCGEWACFLMGDEGMRVWGVLSDSIDSNAYWRKFKERMKKEGNETVTNCHGLKMLTTA